MSRIELDAVRVEYVPDHGEESEVLLQVSGVWNTSDLPMVGDILLQLHQEFVQEGGAFYLSENGEVYPQFRMEQR